MFRTVGTVRRCGAHRGPVKRSQAARCRPTSVHRLPALPQGWDVLRLRVTRWDIDEIPRGRARRLAKAVFKVSGLGTAPVALVRTNLLRDGISAQDVDDWLLDTIEKSNGLVIWRKA